MNSFEYKAKDAQFAVALSEWDFTSYSATETCVLPDGCQDLIVKEDAEQGCSWFVSDLSASAYSVPTAAGIHMRGIRLQPGVIIRRHELGAWLEGRDIVALFGSDQLAEFCMESETVTQALACLASGEQTVQCAAGELGVSVRSLQRLIKSATGQSPYFWFSLARVRRAGRTLGNYDRLSDAAVECGFADQAHMNREMKKWFRRTPNEVKQDPEIRDLLAEPGYG